MTKPLSIVILGLSISSSWGNGHATTYRALTRGLRDLGHRVLFLEREQPWYAEHRDLPAPDYCALGFYDDPAELSREIIASADAVIIGSYVPDGIAVIDRVAAMQPDVLCFYDIDTPVTLAGLETGACDYLAARQIPLFDIYFSFAGGRSLDMLRGRYGAREPRALYCSVDPAAYAPTGEALEWDLGYLGTYSADRQQALERLLLEPARRLPGMRFVVAGPQYPAEMDWPKNVERIEHLPPIDHASFYSRQRYTLNVTRQDMARCGWSPSVRLFEAAACGAPVISDRWEGLEELFPGNAVRIADNADDVVRLLEALPEAERIDQARRARGIVLSKHIGLARAQELADAVSRAASGSLNEQRRALA